MLHNHAIGHYYDSSLLIGILLVEPAVNRVLMALAALDTMDDTS